MGFRKEWQPGEWEQWQAMIKRAAANYPPLNLDTDHCDECDGYGCDDCDHEPTRTPEECLEEERREYGDMLYDRSKGA